jgi:hypothetical protein
MLQKKKPASDACGLCVLINAGALPGKVDTGFPSGNATRMN